LRRAAGVSDGSASPQNFLRELPTVLRKLISFFSGRQRTVGNSRRIFLASAELHEFPQKISGFCRAARVHAENFWLLQSCRNSRRIFLASAELQEFPQKILGFCRAAGAHAENFWLLQSCRNSCRIFLARAELREFVQKNFGSRRAARLS
jgi:hypothetical protein